MPKNYMVKDTMTGFFTPCHSKASAMSLVSRLEAADKYDGLYRPHRYVIIIDKSFYGFERGYSHEA